MLNFRGGGGGKPFKKVEEKGFVAKSVVCSVESIACCFLGTLCWRLL